MILGTVKPSYCQLCNNTMFHKTDNKIQTFKDIVDGQIVYVQIKRQRYRCTNCHSKVWDLVVGGDTYKQKTDRYLEYKNELNEAVYRRNI
jgi:transposase